MLKIVELKGADSADFLHRVTAGPVKGILPGSGRPGLLLTGQAQMIAQFDLLCLERDHFWLVSPEPCAAALANGLEAMHFSERLEISLTNERASARIETSSARLSPQQFDFKREGAELCWPSPVSGYEFSTEAQGIPAGWDFERIGALVPWPPFDWDSSTKALEAAMLPWIDRNKGCYPGQEVVELSLNVGHPARVLIGVEAQQPFSPAGSIPWGEGAALVTSAAAKEGKNRALLRLPWAKKDFLPPGFCLLRSHW